MTGKVQQFEALSKAIEFSSQAHRVTGQNIANLNTPGYQSLEVRFDELLNRLDGSKPTTAAYEVHQVQGLAVRNDGNNVDLDHELAALKKNALAFQTLSQLLGSKMGIMKQAIRG